MQQPATPILLRARWVVPVTAPPIRDGAVLVHGERIAAVGSAQELLTRAPPQVRRMEFADGIVVAGLVNPHTHLENTHFADAINRQQPFDAWIAQMRMLVSAQSFDEAVAAARDGANKLLRYGVTCVGDSSFHGATLIALKEVGLRGIVFKEFICPTDDILDDRWTAFAAWLDSAPTDERVQVGIMVHAPYTVTPSAYRRALTLAMKRRLPFSTHVAEAPAERALIERRTGKWAQLPIAMALRDVPIGLSPIRYLNWLGVFRHDRLLLIHCVQVDDADIALLAARPVWVVHCPRSNANLQVGTMPLQKMLAAGVKVCLATDGLASAESLNPLDEVRFARRQAHRDASFSPPLSADRWLRMVTLDAAAALGLDNAIGALEVGKQADIAVFPSGDTRDPLETLLSEATEAIATMVAGRFVWLAK